MTENTSLILIDYIDIFGKFSKNSCLKYLHKVNGVKRIEGNINSKVIRIILYKRQVLYYMVNGVFYLYTSHIALI